MLTISPIGQFFRMLYRTDMILSLTTESVALKLVRIDLIDRLIKVSQHAICIVTSNDHFTMYWSEAER